MDLYRFFIPDLARSGDGKSVTLPEEEVHHARRVLRMGNGDAAVAFDGRGNWAEGRVALTGKHVQLAIGRIQTDPPSRPRLTLATAVPKGERADWLVEQASQLNVTRLQWLSSERGVVKPREGGGKMEKWRRLAIESAKQCGRTHLLQIEEPVELTELPFGDDGGIALWLDPRADAGIGDYVDSVEKVLALVGPEGGWSDAECAMLQAASDRGQLKRVALTRTILRIETACAAIAALVMSRR